MGEMGDAGAEEGESSDAREQVKQQQTGDEELRRDRDRHEHHRQLGVGMEKSKGHQEPVNRPGGAEHGRGVDLVELDEHRLDRRIPGQLAASVRQQVTDGGRRQSRRDQLGVQAVKLLPADSRLGQTGPHAAEEVEKQKAPCAPLPLQDAAKGNEREHVEENMAQAPMQEHMRHQLPQAKVAVGRIPERAGIDQLRATVRQQDTRGKEHDVQDQQGGDRPGHATHGATVASPPPFATPSYC
jgi:hypothetical protein